MILYIASMKPSGGWATSRYRNTWCKVVGYADHVNDRCQRSIYKHSNRNYSADLMCEYSYIGQCRVRSWSLRNSLGGTKTAPHSEWGEIRALQPMQIPRSYTRGAAFPEFSPRKQVHGDHYLYLAVEVSHCKQLGSESLDTSMNIWNQPQTNADLCNNGLGKNDKKRWLKPC